MKNNKRKTKNKRREKRNCKKREQNKQKMRREAEERKGQKLDHKIWPKTLHSAELTGYVDHKHNM